MRMYAAAHTRRMWPQTDAGTACDGRALEQAYFGRWAWRWWWIWLQSYHKAAFYRVRKIAVLPPFG